LGFDGGERTEGDMLGLGAGEEFGDLGGDVVAKREVLDVVAVVLAAIRQQLAKLLPARRLQLGLGRRLLLVLDVDVHDRRHQALHERLVEERQELLLVGCLPVIKNEDDDV
jgi:hypothetical protein